MIELRKYSLELVAEFAEIRNDFDVLRYAYDKVPYPFTEKDSYNWIYQQINDDPAKRFMIFWEGQLAGEIGITLGEDIFRLNAEIGYFIARKFWGKGIASSAISQMTNYVFNNFEVVRINAGVMEPNKASMRALEKNGYLLEVVRKQAVVKHNNIMTNYHFVKFKTPLSRAD